MREGAFSTRQREEAALEFEQKLTLEGHTPTVQLRPNQIKTRPELFQQREFTYGLRHLNNDHVKSLTRQVHIYGELDPILVSRLKGVGWVCLAGHHRIEAYKEAGKGDDEVTCDWSKSATARDAMDESMASNKKDKLPLPQQDRLEEAWKGELLGWWSKDEAVQRNGVGDGTIGKMRRVIATAKALDGEDGDKGDLFRQRLGVEVSEKEVLRLIKRAKGALDDVDARRKYYGMASVEKAVQCLKEMSWARVRMVHAGVEGKAITKEEEGEKLARRINAKLSNLLSRDPEVTAIALMRYDRQLPEQLIAAWGRLDKTQSMDDDL
jgi:ParB-like chromosome segregation protein Spo0J